MLQVFCLGYRDGKGARFTNLNLIPGTRVNVNIENQCHTVVLWLYWCPVLFHPYMVISEMALEESLVLVHLFLSPLLHNTFIFSKQRS